MGDLFKVTRAHGLEQRVVPRALGIGPAIHGDAHVILVTRAIVLGGVNLVVGYGYAEVDVALRFQQAEAERNVLRRGGTRVYVPLPLDHEWQGVPVGQVAIHGGGCSRRQWQRRHRKHGRS